MQIFGKQPYETNPVEQDKNAANMFKSIGGAALVGFGIVIAPDILNITNLGGADAFLDAVMIAVPALVYAQGAAIARDAQTMEQNAQVPLDKVA